MIGYLCAYLRYYCPYEFITAYLNNADNEDDIKNGNELATLYGIKIIPPKFGISKDEYVFNKEKKVIAKGLSSVKYMNAKVAVELFELASTQKPKSFADFLLMAKGTHLDARQRDVLIKIDFFSEYGNSRELLRITDLFAFFKNGDAKKIGKEKLKQDLLEVVAQYSSDMSKQGKVLKSYTITDMQGLLNCCEQKIKEMEIADFDMKSKIQNQLEILGYVDLTTGKEVDRRKLLITDVYPLRGRDSNEIWAYAIFTKSIGSGKAGRLTVKSYLYDRDPIKRFDIIHLSDMHKDKKGYWNLTKYYHIA